MDSITQVLEGVPRERTHLLEALHMAGAAERRLDAADLRALALHLRIPEGEFWGIFTSYPDFNGEHRQPPIYPPQHSRRALLERPPVFEGRPVRAACAEARLAPDPMEGPVGCPGCCWAWDAAEPPDIASWLPLQERRLTANFGRVRPSSLDDYMAAGGFNGLARATELGAERALEEVDASGLRGRGGAYFPAAAKYKAVRQQGRTASLVVNAEEGEPGVFKDRHLLEGDPFRLIEGALIAAFLTGAEEIVIFLNGEARVAHGVLLAALGDLGDYEALFSPWPSFRVVRGGGGYVLGEESAMLEAIEGRKPQPRIKPPYPVESGLWGRPTAINNVETLANLPGILAEGAAWFRSVGNPSCPGTKLFSLTGAVQRWGLVELPTGASLRTLLVDIAGGAADGEEIEAVVLGGPSGGLLPATMLDVALVPGPALHETGAIVGSGGIHVVGKSTGVGEAVRQLAAYNAAESCGKCTPCREGAPRLRDLLDAPDRDDLDDLNEALQLGSLCALGGMAPGPVRSALHFFPQLFD